MLRPSFLGFVSLLMLAVSVVSTRADTLELARPDYRNFVVNEASVNQVARVFGFITAQTAVLRAIARQHPQLAQQSEAYRRLFDASFGFPEQSARWFLEYAMGNHLAEQHAIQMTRQAEEAVPNLTLVEAQAFFAEVDARLKGQMDVSVFRGMLWLRYAARPGLEMREWWQSFSTEGHPKATGVDLTLRLPFSWRQQEGDRPHIVAKWTSQDGTGDMVITLLIRVLPEQFTFGDMLEVEQSNDWASLIPEGFSFLDGRAIELDRQPGLQFDAMGERRILDTVLANRTRTYLIFPPSRMIQIACGIANISNIEEPIITRRYNELKDLCRQIALTVTFPDSYR